MSLTRVLTIDVRQTGDAIKGIGETAGSIGKLGLSAAGAATGGLALLGGATLGVGVALVGLGSDAEEMQGKFDTVFGASAPEATKALDDFGNAVGRNKFELMDMAAATQDTLVPLGFARDSAADMSVELSKLSVDLASFNNLSERDVSADLISALTGETEVMKKYGVVINEAAVKQEALNAGLVTAEVNQTDLAQASQALSIAQQKYNEALSAGGPDEEKAAEIKAKITAAQIKLTEQNTKYGADSSQVAGTQARLLALQNDYNAALEGGGSSSLKVQQAQLSLSKAQEAYDKAVEGSIPDLDAQTKAQATLNLIMKGTSDAQGDAERTSGSWANQQRALTAELSEAATAMGLELVPITTQFLAATTDLARDILPQAVLIFKDFALELQANLTPAIAITNDALTRIAAAFGMNTSEVSISDVVLGAFKLTLDAFIIAVQLGAVVMNLLADAVEGMRAVWDETGDFVQDGIEGWETAFDAVSDTIGWVSDSFNDMAQAALDAVNSIPDWLIPGSPTPFELGLRGIAQGAEQVAGTLPQAFGVASTTTGAPAAPAGGSAPVVVQLQYSPVLSTADEIELERVLTDVVNRINARSR